MKAETAFANLVMGWLWIIVGFGSGLLMGLNFHREEWLGGYGSWKRRLYRLMHISFFGLAIMNLFFFFTIHAGKLSGICVQIASWCFVVGAITMPACCLLMAQYPRFRLLFGIPITSLLLASVLTFWEIIK